MAAANANSNPNLLGNQQSEANRNGETKQMPREAGPSAEFQVTGERAFGRNVVPQNFHAFHQDFHQSTRSNPRFAYAPGLAPYGFLHTPSVAGEHGDVVYPTSGSSVRHSHPRSFENTATQFGNTTDVRYSLPDLPQRDVNRYEQDIPHGNVVHDHHQRRLDWRSQLSRDQQEAGEAVTGLQTSIQSASARRPRPASYPLTPPTSASYEGPRPDIGNFSQEEVDLILYLALCSVPSNPIAVELHRCSGGSVSNTEKHLERQEAKIQNRLSHIVRAKGTEQDAQKWIERILTNALANGWSDKVLQRARELTTTTSRAERMSAARERAALVKYRANHPGQNPTASGCGRGDINAYNGFLRELKAGEREGDRDKDVLKARLMEMWEKGEVEGRPVTR